MRTLIAAISFSHTESSYRAVGSLAYHDISPKYYSNQSNQFGQAATCYIWQTFSFVMSDHSRSVQTGPKRRKDVDLDLGTWVFQKPSKVGIFDMGLLFRPHLSLG